MDHAPAHQSRGDLAVAPQSRPRHRRPPRTLQPSGGHAWRAAAHEARTGHPDRSGRPSMTVRPSPVSLVALGPGAAPQTGPSCARNPATNAPVYPKESAPDSRCWSGVRLDRSGVVVGVVAGVVVTPDTDRGGVSGKMPCGCQAATCSFPLWLFVCFVVSRPRRDAPAKTERTGATPFFDRWRGQSMGGGVPPGVRPGVTPPTGSLPSYLSLLYGLLHLCKGFIHPGRVRSGAASFRGAGMALPPAAC